jgi:putative DNA helicase
MKKTRQLYSISKFAYVMRRLYKKEQLTEEESEYILSCSLLLLKEYDNTNEKELFELAYNIVLRYALLSKNYQPLYDVSCNYGFYPSVQFISKNHLLENSTVQDVMINFSVEMNYRNDGYIETYEQHRTRKNIISSKKKSIAFIAPTSSGKSSLIIQHIKSNERIRKAVVLVPTKSLIAQSYMDLRKGIFDRKIISHEGMYNGETEFIGALTQERLLRLLEKNDSLFFDCIYVDEAHNIFSNDNRNVLLARALKMCKERNEKTQVIFLSPFINEVDNLIMGSINEIDEQRISFNIKEPDIFVRCRDGKIKVYDRFLGDFYSEGNSNNAFEYIKTNQKNKNFIFVNTPFKIESFAEDLYANTEEITPDRDLKELQQLLAESVHPEFNIIKYLSHGIIYLHAKMPDHIKEYLEYQFKQNKKIKYLVANVVIMEGINLPIDSLFICNVWNMTSSALQNLIGRVNRLNIIFDKETGSLTKLIPKIYFVDVPKYTAKNRNLENVVKKIYEGSRDEVRNPLLSNCSLEDLKVSRKEKVEKLNQQILVQEKLYYSDTENPIELFRKKLISSGMNQFIDISYDNAVSIMNNIKNCDFSLDVIDIVSWVFTKNVTVINQEFSRLSNPAAVKFYKFFMAELKKGDFAALITSQLEYQLTRAERDKEPYMYVGRDYGDEMGWNENIAKGQKVYVDIRKKSRTQLINLIIVKTKVEQEFLGFQYSRAVNFLHDNGYLSNEKFNLEMYGTNDESKIQLLNLGLSFSILNVLESNNQFKNISLDSHGNMVANKQLSNFKKNQNGLIRYELDKYILFK